MPRIAPGATVPDLALPDHAGNARELSALLGGDPTVLHFYRGWWCPKEQAFFRRLVELQDEAEVAYTNIVSVSVDPPEVAAAFRAGIGARWTFLCDPEHAYVEVLDLLEVADTIHRPYLPTVAVLRPDRTVATSYDGYWYWARPSLEELRGDLRGLTRELRDDFEPPR
ncbi:MAG: redoxin domain-containing protein [Solirubrobacterales bacterium]|nr:redoxin domain-containing protein [Solirubrobacterales bacterium]